ncbi:MAG: hypothetical protein EON59_14650 [Alphaproteobacteria bacterium]|nr:MAG: hypothetical protein EON59_14650 [Alphaproteobacteria bacterium]
MDSGKPEVATKSIAWQRILLVFALASLVIGAVFLAPVIKHEMEARQTARIKRVHAEGLIPCEQFGGVSAATDSELLAQLPARPILSITAYPSFYDSESVHLVGGDLYYVRRQHPSLEVPPRPADSRTPRVTKVSKARLSDPVASQLVKLVDSDIAHASAAWPMGLDGTTYYFETPKGCAAAWSPDADTRAGKMVGLFWSLAARASNSGLPKDKVDDAILLKTIERLQAS